ncbi:MAG: orotate phosphoribosyltransferase [Chloroflexota bacterium]|nr:orotate phosphoribosyltransferase [Chloroflexota bacterium]
MDAEKLLTDASAVLQGHFLLSSGLHSPTYVEKFELIQHPEITVQLCAGIAERYRDAGVQTVAGPTTGGAILAFEVARQMGVRCIIAERSEDGGREFRRGFRIGTGERVLVADDVLTTGGSVLQTVQAVERLGGVVVGAGILVDRSGGSADAGTSYWAALSLEVEAFTPEQCPQCAQGVPLTRRGTSGP